tara:strand:+ start:2729 stop:4042 length:1314 start_codon:yes stop_codon:yes gene_type:complete
MMLLKSESDSVRMDAAKQAEKSMAEDPSRIAALETLVWEYGHPQKLRHYAIDQLIAHDEASFRQQMHRRIVQILSYETIEYLFKVANERGWGDSFTPTIVRQYARHMHGIKEEDRPERQVLLEMHPDQSVEETVFNVFVQAGKEDKIISQADAWDLLARISTKQQLIDYLDRAPADTAMVADLKAAAADLHIVAFNKEGNLWLSYLRKPEMRPYWHKLKEIVATLNDDQKSDLKLRHLAPLLAATPQQRQQSRIDLISDINAFVNSQKHHLKGATYDGGSADHPQEFSQSVDKLTWPDLLVISQLINAMQSHAVTSDLFAWADADKTDTSTEYGGTIRKDDGVFNAKLFKPRIRRHDRRFYPTPKMYDDLYTALSHYHFHAQQHHNSDYAGPGRGDLKFAKLNQFSCLVFTFINQNNMNVDYYQEGDIVVDLGTIVR